MTTLLRALRLLSVACAASLALAAFVASAGGRGESPAAARQDGGRRPAGAEAARDEDPVDALDRVVRARFHNHIGFGMARIATERRFEPETEEEKRAVRAVRRAGLRVGLFIVGRGVLADPPPGVRRPVNSFGGFWPGRGVAGPIFLNATEAKSLPDGDLYWDEARRAMLAFAAGAESYDFEAGGWKAAARPVRAAESCLQCHTADTETRAFVVDGKTFYEVGPGSNRLKVGDPLGAMLYIYRRKG